MPIIACPHCGTRLNSPDSALGREVVCGRCKRAFVAASEGEATATAAVSPVPVPGAAVVPGVGAPVGVPAGVPAAAPPVVPPLAAGGFAAAPPIVSPPPVMPGAYLPPPQPLPGFPQSPPPTSGNAVASLILGIASIVLCWCLIVPVICGVLALVFHSNAMRDIHAGSVTAESVGMARAGRICGLIGLVLTLVGWGIVIVSAIVANL